MPNHKLRLYTDELSANACSAPLSEANRALYVASGTAIIRSGRVATALGSNSAWQSRVMITVAAGTAGARLLRWELSTGEPELLRGNELRSELTLEGEPHIDPGVAYLMRCDRVDFPAGGIAYMHTHQGSGIRCLQQGKLRIETQGRDFWVEAPGAWLETGVDPVLAEAWAESRSHFIRVMILPRALRGQSSIRYVNSEDRDKPKCQTYQVFLDEPVDL